MKIFILCEMTLHSFVYLYRRFGGVLKGSLRRVDPLRLCPFLDHPEDGSIQLFRNIGTHIPTYTASCSRSLHQHRSENFVSYTSISIGYLLNKTCIYDVMIVVIVVPQILNVIRIFYYTTLFRLQSLCNVVSCWKWIMDGETVGILIEVVVRYVNAFTGVELDTWSQPVR
jgi:hypothetical protein